MTTDLIPDYPRHPGEATPQWVTWALRQNGLIDDAQVVSVTPRALGAGVGFLSGIAQLSLAWDRSEPGAMSSVILKMDCDSEFFRNVGEGELHVFEREIHFYREMAPQAPIRLTRCYHTQMDPALGHYILLFEDLTALESLDEVKGIKLDLALIALATIARFHAAWWENPERAKFEWMPRLPSMICDGFHERWPIFKKEFANSFSAEAIAAGELVNQNIERIAQRLDRGPETIVHSDFRGDNLLFDKSSPDGIVVLDWQLAMRGNALYDVARLITDTVHPGDGSRPH